MADEEPVKHLPYAKFHVLIDECEPGAILLGGRKTLQDL